MKNILYTLVLILLGFNSLQAQVEFEIDPSKISTGLLFAQKQNSRSFHTYYSDEYVCGKNSDWLQRYMAIYQLNAFDLLSMQDAPSLYADTRMQTEEKSKATMIIMDYDINVMNPHAYTEHMVSYSNGVITDLTTEKRTPLVESSIQFVGIEFPLLNEQPKFIEIDLHSQFILSNKNHTYTIDIMADDNIIASKLSLGSTINVKFSDLLTKDITIIITREDGSIFKRCYKVTKEVIKPGLPPYTLLNPAYILKAIDKDGDGIKNKDDNCPYHYNPLQADQDQDGIGDHCDDDIDGDGYLNWQDNCPLIANPGQEDSDNDGLGDVCEEEVDNDADDDLIDDLLDNCPNVFNPFQADMDEDGLGDLCDDDIDGDGVLNEDDNSPIDPNPDQKDTDGDGVGDVSDPDIDGDGVLNNDDNCEYTPNAGQEDFDFDGIGTLCDPNENVGPNCTINPSYTQNIIATQKFTMNIGSNPDVVIDLSTDELVDDYVVNMSSNSASGLIGSSFGTAKIAVYLNPNHSSLKKPVIISDGFDPDNSRNHKAIFQLFGGNNSLRTIWDNGYDLIIVDYKYGADFIEKNAYAMQEVIRMLVVDEGVEEIPAIVGPSMGGLIVSFALMDWEARLKPSYGPHKVKTFMSGDVPWRGANVSPGVSGFTHQIKSSEMIGLSLNSKIASPAARQMVINEFTTNYSHEGGPYFYFPGNHYLFDQFYNKLNAMGLLPAETEKNIAIVAGALSNAGSDLPPAGTNIVDAKAKVDFGIFGDINASIRLNSIKDYQFPFKQDGLGLFLDDVLCFNGSNELDNAKGSFFGLTSQIEDMNYFVCKLGVTIEASLKLKAEYTFVPTYSALAADTEDPNLDFTNNSPDGFGGLIVPESPFDFVFMDNENSAHVGFVNNEVNGAGTDFNWAMSHISDGNNGQITENCDELVENILTKHEYVIQGGNEIYLIYHDDMKLYPTTAYTISVEKIGGNIDLDFVDIGCFGFLTNEYPCETEGTGIYRICVDVVVPGCTTSLCETITITLEPEGDCNMYISEPEIENIKHRSKDLVTIIPNPNNGQFDLRNVDEGVVQIYSSRGELVYQDQVQQNAKLDLQLSSGVFVCRFFNIRTNKTETIQFVVTND